MEVHSPFHYSHHHQPRFYEPRTAPYPHYQTRLDSPYVREAPPAPSYHHRRGPSYGGSSSPRQAEPIKLPGISDLLNYSRDSDLQSSMQRSQPQPRPEPTWPRSVAPAPSLKVETSNIDPRLHKPASPPHPGNASIDSRTSPLMPAARQSPAYSHSVGPASAYPSSAFSEDANQSKRLSLQSAQSAVSSRSSASGGYPSPETAKSGISMYPPVPPRRQSPGGLVNQRPLPQDFPGPQAARAPSPPRQHTHVAHPAPTVPQPMYIDTRPAAQSHPYHVSPTMSHQVQQTPTSAPQTPASSTSMAAVPNSAPQLQDRYVCPSCSKAFSRPSSLRIHSHSHTGEKPFKCTRKGCGKAFSVRSNMKRHERGCHIDGSGPGDSSPRSMSGEA